MSERRLHRWKKIGQWGSEEGPVAGEGETEAEMENVEE